MTEEIEAHVLKKYEILQKLGKEPLPFHSGSFPLLPSIQGESTTALYSEYSLNKSIAHTYLY